jgi:cell division cycle 14
MQSYLSFYKIIDVLRGFEYAISLGWYNVKNFNLKDYEFFEKVQNGDLNWIIPGKFAAFSGPLAKSRDQDGVKIILLYF